MKGTLDVSVVMPCMNEAATVARCVRDARRALARSGIRGEVVVADNGSTDGSRRLAAAAGARVVRVRTIGYGAAVRGGVAAARGRVVVMADADRSYDLRMVPAFARALVDGVDIVLGTRLKGRIMAGAMPWSHRRIGTPVLNLLLWILFGVRVSDCQCGMRAFSRGAYAAMAPASTGMEFASEMLVKAGRLKLRIREIPIVYRPAGRRRPPHLRTFVDGWRHLRLLLFMSPASLLLVPGLAMVGVGAAMILASVFRLRVEGYPIGFHFSILGSGLVLLGYQVAHLGLCVSLLRRVAAGAEKARVLLRALSFERVLVLGATLSASGFIMDLVVLDYWLREDFTSFSTAMTNMGIAGTMLILLGVEVTVSGFFLAGLLSPETRNE